MSQFEYGVSDYKLICEIAEDAIVVVGVRGRGSSLMVPAQIPYQDKTYVVKIIDKKAFLGCKTLREVFLPGTITEIRDWAFAQCSQLTNVTMPLHVELGVGVFEDCVCLLQICVHDSTQNKMSEHMEYEDILNSYMELQDFSLDLSVLLANCVTKLPAEDLLRDPEVGSEHWYHKWDQRLLAFLAEDDQEGYQTMVLCGEEDIRKDIPEYVFDKQMRKCDLCMKRVLYSEYLDKDAREEFVKYIASHVKGCASDATWKVIMKEHGDQLVYYDLLADLGGITKDNVDAMLEDLDVKNAEAKVYLIRYKQEHFAQKDAFMDFEL